MSNVITLSEQDTAIHPDYAIIRRKHGTYIVNRHDPFILRTMDEVQQEISDLLPLVQGVVLDIGANVGVHSIGFARKAGMVYSFEPQPMAYYELCTNLMLNGIWNCKPIQCALSSYSGTGTMFLLDPELDNSAAGFTIGEGEYTVPVRTLDSFTDLPQVDFIKIDTEGHEVEVIKGALGILEKFKPTVFIEVHKEENKQPLVDLFTQLGYEHRIFNCQKGYLYTDFNGTLGKDLSVLTVGYVFSFPGKVIWKDSSS